MSFDYQLGSAPARAARRVDAQTPMRILVIGDFSGRGERVLDDFAKRRPLPVDIDTFDAVVRRIAPRATLAGGAADPIEIAFDDLDAFHPDSLYKRVTVFARLRELRERMRNRATFAAAAEAFRAHQGEPPAATPVMQPQASGKTEDDADTLSRLLGRGTSAPSQAAPADGINTFIRTLIAEHIQPDAPPHQGQYVTAIDAAIAGEMRSILHAAEFQALESAWRGLYWLVANLELGESLELFVLDAKKPELLRDMQAAPADLAAAALYKTLVEAPSVAGAQPWSLIIALDEFGASGEDIALLAPLGAIAAQAGAPVIAAARPGLAGHASFATANDPSRSRAESDSSFESWQALRRSAMAPWIGLAAPRMLLRLPYGKLTDPIESFDFDEIGREREHDAYLWGSGALACALLIGRAFLARGWDMEPGDALDVDDLPAHTYEEDGEKRLQPCAETLLTENAGQALLERGLIPLLSYKNRNAVRVLRFQSIAEPSQPLAGPWA
jgi:type VI secretion system protein ImpC